MFKVIRIVFFIVLFALLHGGCTKNKRNDILGSWKLLTLREEPENAPYIRFTFRDDMVIQGVTIVNGEPQPPIVEGVYSIKFKHARYEMKIECDNRFEINQGPDYRGTYVIDELSRDVLRLIRIEGHNDQGVWTTGGDAFIMLDFLRE